MTMRYTTGMKAFVAMPAEDIAVRADTTRKIVI
jgi:hypothetical protein